MQVQGTERTPHPVDPARVFAGNSQRLPIQVVSSLSAKTELRRVSQIFVRQGARTEVVLAAT